MNNNNIDDNNNNNNNNNNQNLSVKCRAMTLHVKSSAMHINRSVQHRQIK